MGFEEKICACGVLVQGREDRDQQRSSSGGAIWGETLKNKHDVLSSFFVHNH